MFLIDSLILGTGVLLLLGIASSKLSNRLGVPVLVLFLVLGMLAGSDGIGGIEFENYRLAHGIGTLALAMILFDGGLSTPISSVRAVWKPAMLLATLGVLITSIVTGLAASWILGISMLEGMLLGSIVGSTDAAAVFSVLRSGGVSLRDRLKSTLEVESGANDPMAIFLTVGCIEILMGRLSIGPDLVWLFVKQMAVGAIAGVAVGYAAIRIVNAINLYAAGLYPVLVTAFGLLAFGLAVVFGGSGFLAIYLAGIVIGNSRLVFQRGIVLFHDAAAWLSQIVMFVVLGLLSFPSRLVDVAWHGLAIGAVLMLVARPLAVMPFLFPFGYNWRESILVSWVGLKGAVPITLATFPLMFGTPHASLMFDVVFFVVVLSAFVQGSSLSFAARRLGLEIPIEIAPPLTLEISSLIHVEGDIVDYTVGNDSRAAGRCVQDLALPEGVVIALVARQDKIIPPQGKTRIEAKDHVIVVLRPDVRHLVDQVFGNRTETSVEQLIGLEFPLRGKTTVSELEDMYGITMGVDREMTLDEAVRKQLGGIAAPGLRVRFGLIDLSVRRIASDKTIEQIGMIIHAEPEDVPMNSTARTKTSSSDQP
jgi:potassium/hydrogen antiporter